MDDVDSKESPEEQRKRRLRRIELLELDVADLVKAPKFGDYIVEKAEPLHLNQKSPLPGDETHLGTVDLQVRKYRVTPTEKYRFQHYLLVVGVVAPTSRGWLFIEEGTPLRVATAEDVELLPHLPDDWESFLVNVK